MSTPPSGPVSLVLASASPARLKLLHAAGVEPRVYVSAVDEVVVVAAAREGYGELEPADVALLLARAKADDVASQVHDALVLGCDSVLELDGEVHGKPGSGEEARSRWQRMRGRSGVLHTGHWLVDHRADHGSGATLGATLGATPGATLGATFGATASTTVHFARLTDAEIDAYVATGEPLWVAGAFTIDGLGGPYVTGIEGDPSNVVGLSLPLLREMVAEVGLGWGDLLATRFIGSPDKPSLDPTRLLG